MGPLATLVVFLALGCAVFLPPRLWPDERRAVGTARLLGAGVLAGLALVPAVLYHFAISISAGLCGGGRAWPTLVAVVLPLAVVGSWGLRGRNRVLLAWPLAVVAAAACVAIAEYLDPRAHGQCETWTPYSVTVLPSFPMYSARLSSSFAPPRRNTT